MFNEWRSEEEKYEKQLRWERNVAIDQLKAHMIPFGGIQQPLTLEQAIRRTQEFGCVWVELHGEGIKEFSFFVCGVVEDSDPERFGLLLLGDEDVYINRKDTYGKTWRAWAIYPSEEDMRKNEWMVGDDQK